MIIKVCGVRTAEVAEAAVDAGADWIGLVFAAASPRYADDATAMVVRAAVAGRADLVGVFVDSTAALCNRLADRYSLAAVQLHGAIDPQIVVAIDAPVIRGINVASASEAFTYEWWPDGTILLDAAPAPGGLPGGTGREVDLAVAAEVARHRRIMLAGGLRPDTVGAAIAPGRPRGVDATSGLETAPGVKDPGRVERYVVAARAAGDRDRGVVRS
jgi:phosphoribosylanthranilate isomerase